MTKRITQKDRVVFARELKEHPFEWRPIPTTSSHPYILVSRQRAGEIPTLPPPEFQARAINGIACACYAPGKEGK